VPTAETSFTIDGGRSFKVGRIEGKNGDLEAVPPAEFRGKAPDERSGGALPPQKLTAQFL